MIPRRLLALLSLLAALVMPATVHAAPDWDRIGGITFDVAILRPLGFGKLVVGSVIFIPAAIVTSPGGRASVSDAWAVFVQEPADSLFDRELNAY